MGAWGELSPGTAKEGARDQSCRGGIDEGFGDSKESGGQSNSTGRGDMSTCTELLVDA